MPFISFFIPVKYNLNKRLDLIIGGLDANYFHVSRTDWFMGSSTFVRFGTPVAPPPVCGFCHKVVRVIFDVWVFEPRILNKINNALCHLLIIAF